MTNGTDHGMLNGVVEALINRASNDIINGMHNDIIPGAHPNGTHEHAMNGDSNVFSNGMHEDVATGNYNGLSNGRNEHTLIGKPYFLTSGIPNGIGHGAGSRFANNSANQLTNGLPRGLPNGIGTEQHHHTMVADRCIRSIKLRRQLTVTLAQLELLAKTRTPPHRYSKEEPAALSLEARMIWSKFHLKTLLLSYSDSRKFCLKSALKGWNYS